MYLSPNTTQKPNTFSHQKKTKKKKNNRAFQTVFKMSPSMTMEERFEAIMKKCEYLQAHHKGKKNQNAYLRRPLDVPKFEGRLDPVEFLEWLQAVERAFKFKEIP